jgi:hypothetical protein
VTSWNSGGIILHGTKTFRMNEAAHYAKSLTASLPGNRELLSKVRRYGLQKI